MMFPGREGEPQPKSINVVVAEGDEYWRDVIAESLVSNNEFTARPILVQTFEQLLNESIMGKSLAPRGSMQADMVIIGDSFEYDTNNWSPSNYQEVNKLIMEFDEVGVKPTNIDLLTPSELNFATILRSIGFNGSIVLVSEAPREDGLLAEIKEYEEMYNIEGLINAVSHRKSFFRQDFHYWLPDKDGVFQLHTDPEQPNLCFVLGEIVRQTVDLDS